MLTKILIIEDEQKTVAFLRKGLSEQGYVVDVAGDGQSGLYLARDGSYGLILLDVMLPGRDGWAVLSDLRDAGVRAPVVVLSARHTVEERVRGLRLGADDYLPKPFAFAELLARIQSILRRTPPRPTAALKVADLKIDPIGWRASRAGRPLELTAKEFALLLLLAERAGEVLSRTLIAGHVWDMNYEGDLNVVDVHVRRLRAKVDEPFEKKLIHTIRRAGYVLESRD